MSGNNFHTHGTHRPTPSIVIPTCDRPQGLLTSVHSALRALPNNGTMIVVDDGTIHSARSTLEGILDERMSIVDLRSRSGPSAARNLGVQRASGDLVFFLDDDDRMEPDYITRVLTVLSAAQSDWEFGFSSVKSKQRIIGKQIPTGPLPSGPDLTLRLAGLGMGFWIQKTTFDRVGGLDTEISVNEDTEFCLRLAEKGVSGWYEADPGVVLNPPTKSTRLAELKSITKSTSPLKRAAAFERILKRRAKILSQHKTLRRSYVLRVLRYTAFGDKVATSMNLARTRYSDENFPFLWLRLTGMRLVRNLTVRK